MKTGLGVWRLPGRQGNQKTNRGETMQGIRRPEMSSDQLARKLKKEAKRALMLNPPEASSPEKLRREIDRLANNEMRRGLTKWVSTAKRQARAMERIQKKAWKERDKALAAVERLKPTLAAYPNDGEILGKMRTAKREVREQYKRYGLAGQAKANWHTHRMKIEGILNWGLKEKGKSFAGLFIEQGRR